MSTLAEAAGALAGHADNLAQAGYANVADELQVIARSMRRWQALLDAIYDETIQEIAMVEDRAGRRRQAIPCAAQAARLSGTGMTGDVAVLRKKRVSALAKLSQREGVAVAARGASAPTAASLAVPEARQ